MRQPTTGLTPETSLRSLGDAGAYRDNLRDAMDCLELSGRRLRRGSTEQTDEVLDLLRSAARHLDAALQADRSPDAH